MASGTRQAELWGPSAQGWADVHESYSLPLTDWILDHLMNGSAAHILDAGCGAGGSLEKAAARGARVTGTDVAPEMLTICKQRLPHGEFHVADSEALPFADATFDSVMAINSLQFTETPVNALNEFARVSKPHANIGVVCFGTFEQSNFAAIGAAIKKLFANPPKIEGPYSLSPPRKLHAAVAAANFKIVEQTDTEMVRVYNDFEEFWRGQAGTGATRFSVRELGKTLVRDTMREACQPYTDSAGRIRLSNVFHSVILEK